ncbi:MAG: DUF1015 domain-containing protein, partial [Actinomycetota bacterium]|nr:DUF1015 domain-containing protein [Actinomycetota bacterium]
ADGHHRYETALAYHQERGGEPGDHDSIMCFCVDADSEELVVLPYNRVLRSAAGDLPDRLRGELDAQPLDVGAGGEPDEFLTNSKADHAFVFVLPGETFGVEVSDAQVVAAVGERAPAWRALDVVALHEVVFPAVLPGGPDEIAFTKDPSEIERRLRDGWTAGVLLRALRPADVVEVATSGERMPQKASYFWPKAATGLVFHTLD